MIQTYHLLDGGQITAASPEEFVRDRKSVV